MTRLTVAEKVKIIAERKGISMQELANRLLMTRQNLNQKINRNNFKEEDIAKLAKALDVDFEIHFILNDKSKI